MTDEIAGTVGRLVQTRPLPAPSEAWLALGARRAQIAAWLEGHRPARRRPMGQPLLSEQNTPQDRDI